MFTAYYAPLTSEGETDPTKSGFASYDKAAAWIRDNCVCDDCRIVCAEKNSDLMDSSCVAEWYIVETDKLDQCESFSDVLDAAGYKIEWKKDQSQ